MGWGFCDIRNNLGRGKCYQPKPKAEADNPYRDLDYSGYHKTESNNCFIIHCFEENNDKRIIAAITVYSQTLKNIQLSDKKIQQSSAEKLNAFLKKVSLNLYLQVISQFLSGSMKRIEKPVLLHCPWTRHCSWKSCIARATYRLFTNL